MSETIKDKEYDKYQKLQSDLAILVDKHFELETVKGNELFQRMSDAAFDVLLKIKKPAF